MLLSTQTISSITQFLKGERKTYKGMMEKFLPGPWEVT